ncbi:MAG: leucine-rich repeat protein [Bacteroidales bacterium]|nr:leucine-rich repeat protein [Bacteroidales bacterium]
MFDIYVSYASHSTEHVDTIKSVIDVLKQRGYSVCSSLDGSFVDPFESISDAEVKFKEVKNIIIFVSDNYFRDSLHCLHELHYILSDANKKNIMPIRLANGEFLDKGEADYIVASIKTLNMLYNKRHNQKVTLEEIERKLYSINSSKYMPNMPFENNKECPTPKDIELFFKKYYTDRLKVRVDDSDIDVAVEAIVNKVGSPKQSENKKETTSKAVKKNNGAKERKKNLNSKDKGIEQETEKNITWKKPALYIAIGVCVVLLILYGIFLRVDCETIDKYSEDGDTLKWVNRQLKGTYNVKGGTKVIDVLAFAKCAELDTVVLPMSLKQIRRDAFKGCTSLKCVTLPDSLQSIGKYAFVFCTDLKQINIPLSIVEIDDNPFIGCNLKFIIPNNHRYFYEIDSLLIEREHKTLVSYVGKMENVKIPGEVLVIGPRSFAYNKHIKTIDMKMSNVVEICDVAFEECINVHNILFPDSLKKMGSLNPFKCIHFDINSGIINKYYAIAKGGYLYDKRNQTLISYLGNDSTIETDYFIDSVGNYALAPCRFKSRVKKLPIKLAPDVFGCNEQ